MSCQNNLHTNIANMVQTPTIQDLRSIPLEPKVYAKFKKVVDEIKTIRAAARFFEVNTITITNIYRSGTGKQATVDKITEKLKAA